MRRTHTAPMEVFSEKSNGTFELEPQEAGWASEAMAMIYVRSVNGPSPVLNARAQISVDGSRWIDLEKAFDPITDTGGYHLNLERFGNWLRLVGEVSGGPEDGSPAMDIDIYWVFKE